jgi:hypothetical protein
MATWWPYFIKIIKKKRIRQFGGDRRRFLPVLPANFEPPAYHFGHINMKKMYCQLVSSASARISKG